LLGRANICFFDEVSPRMGPRSCGGGRHASLSNRLGCVDARRALRRRRGPRKAEELRGDATDIVSGEVRFVYAGEQRVSGGTDTRFCIELAVTRVEKGRATSAPSTQPTGQMIYARCWKPAKRPDGWAGHQGQNLIPKPGQRVRLYVTRDDDGGFDVLEPNGAETVKE
jgi:hypothetical protein